MLGGSAFKKSSRTFSAKERPGMLREEALLVNVAGRGVGIGVRETPCLPLCLLRGTRCWRRVLGGFLGPPSLQEKGRGLPSADLAAPVLSLSSLQPICFRNKYLLLNNQELNELSAISLKANIPEVEAVLNTDR